ncbi:unnamed protein product [Adineta steineri]|uniref:Major facilitator superfamily (MFS) profile domain-containing protein n=1 Tax=Adineta steineri TaxID=433720 RepID=A0A818YAV5_9BILA|nr:unnamed protein product [Adineta steineri]CAF3752254.1 unnamed protein product [Adineta steineri]
MANKDVEKGYSLDNYSSHRTPYRLRITPFGEIYRQQYRGAGTVEKPYIIDWLPNDPENPQTWNDMYKWFLTVFVGIATLAVTFCSSAYVGELQGLQQEFNTSMEVFTLGITLFVLGFAVGPLIWAPFSEVLGRRILFIITYLALTAFNAGTAGSQNMQTVIILRFFSGAFGSSPLTNAGGTLADVFSAKQRGLAMTLFVASPFMGPALGPIVGGFTGDAIGWRWVEGVMTIFTGVIVIIGIICYPETYAPVLLRRRAEKLSKATGHVYRSKFEEKNQVNILHLLKTSLSRPWVFLFREPIVFLLSLYMAIVYGILYMLFDAFPIVYEEERGWSAGIGGLAYIGIAIGFIFAVIYCIWDNRRYSKLVDESPNHLAPPEARLPPAIIGAFALPIGLFWFAWTNYPSIHFMASISAGVPFGFGMLLVFLALMNYLIDTYVIYAASVLAANSVLRSLFGAIFPLFTTQMYHNLGIHWATTIPAFLALLCLPMPYIFWKYGSTIRSWSKYSSEAAAFVARKSIVPPQGDSIEVKPAGGITEEDEDIQELSVSIRL